jgi:hypothetical protein
MLVRLLSCACRQASAGTSGNETYTMLCQLEFYTDTTVVSIVRLNRRDQAISSQTLAIALSVLLRTADDTCQAVHMRFLHMRRDSPDWCLNRLLAAGACDAIFIARQECGVSMACGPGAMCFASVSPIVSRLDSRSVKYIGALQLPPDMQRKSPA